MPIRKIIITGDILRPFDSMPIRSMQNRMVKWIYELLSFQLGLSTGLRVEPLYWDEKEGFDTHKFYSLCGIELAGFEGWAKIYSLKNAPEKASAYVKGFFDDSIVVGYELPEIFENILSESGINYINAATHPARYLDDIFWCLTTNNADIFSGLSKYRLKEEMLYMFAQLRKAGITRQDKLDLRSNSALLIGQTNVDRSLYKDGNIVGLWDFDEKIQAMCEEYSTIYFKPHPYNSDLKRVYEYLAKFKNIEIAGNHNSYHLMAQDEIRKVAGISSSMIYEARYFGREHEFFMPPPFEGLDRPGFSRDHAISIYDDLLNPQFWSDVLSATMETREISDDIRFPASRNRLRVALNMFWGYSFLDEDVLLHNSTALANFRAKIKSLIIRFIPEFILRIYRKNK